MKRALSSFALCLLSAGCASNESAVTRLVHGQPMPGRYIGFEAYAAYARGVQLETHGQLHEAAAAYAEAADEDPDSPEIWTRLGNVRCTFHDRAAAGAFREAERLDPSYEPLWRARAHCDLQRRALDAALHHALVALRLDPNEEETTELVATLYEKRGQIAEARRYLDGWATRSPRSVRAFHALRGFAIRQKDALLKERAEAHLREIERRMPARLSSLPREPFAELDAALAAGDLPLARACAIREHIAAGVLASRAAALGLPKLALQQAEFVLLADPKDADAWAAAVASADLLGDTTALERSLASRSAHGTELDPLSVRLLAEVLGRRVGQEAALVWLRAYGTLPAARDPVERALEQRLQALGP